MIHAVVCYTEYPIGIDEKLFPLCRRTDLRLLLDESIKSLHSMTSLIWSIQQCYCNKPMMTNPGTWKTVLILSHGLDTSRTLFHVPICFSLRREHSSWADSFERFRSRIRSFCWCRVYWLVVLFRLGGVIPSYSCQVTIFGISYIPCYDLAAEQEGLIHERLV